MIDRTGHVYARWTVIERAPNSRPGVTAWRCRCECGTEKAIPSTSLISGLSKSCGCLNSEKAAERARKRALAMRHDLTGRTFGRLTVLGVASEGDGRRTRWRARCKCGTERAILARSMVSGSTASCGCLHREAVVAANSIDLTGHRFHRLTVIERGPRPPHVAKGTFWRCACECGNAINARADQLVTGDTLSCGCWRSDRMRTLAYELAEFYAAMRHTFKEAGALEAHESAA